MTSTQQQLAREQREADKRKWVDAMMVQIRAQRIAMPVSEFKFDRVRNWRLDLAWPVHRVAIELHGGIHSGGRHTRGGGFTRDREKMNEAQLLGWTVLEVTPHHLKSGKAIEWLARALPDVVLRRRVA